MGQPDHVPPEARRRRRVLRGVRAARRVRRHEALLELFDRALLRRNQDEIRSNYISYNTATELSKAEGRGGIIAAPESGGAGARVRGVFQPKSDTPMPGKGKDAAKAAPKAAPATPPAVTPPPAALKSATELAPQPTK